MKVVIVKSWMTTKQHRITTREFVGWGGGWLHYPPHIGGWGALARIDDCDNSQTPTLCLFFLVFALTCPSHNQQIQVALSATSWRAP